MSSLYSGACSRAARAGLGVHAHRSSKAFKGVSVEGLEVARRPRWDRNSKERLRRRTARVGCAVALNSSTGGVKRIESAHYAASRRLSTADISRDTVLEPLCTLSRTMREVLLLLLLLEDPKDLRPGSTRHPVRKRTRPAPGRRETTTVKATHRSVSRSIAEARRRSGSRTPLLASLRQCRPHQQ